MMIDPQRFRGVLGCYPTGVCIVTSLDPEGRPVGMAVGSFTSVSLDPPLVAFLPDRGSETGRHVAAAGRFCVNVLSERQEPLSRAFGGRGEDRFQGLAWRDSPGGMPLIEGVVAWIDCSLHAVHAAGDHNIVVGAVEALEIESSERPLIFHRGGYGQMAAMLEAA